MSDLSTKFNPVGWFEIPALDLERASTFYSKLLDIEMKRADFMDFEMVWFPGDAEAKGISGALMKGVPYQPTLAGPIVYFTCSEIDEVLAQVKDLGGKIFIPKKSIGPFGYIAIIGDTEGNRVGLHSRA